MKNLIGILVLIVIGVLNFLFAFLAKCELWFYVIIAIFWIIVYSYSIYSFMKHKKLKL